MLNKKNTLPLLIIPLLFILQSALAAADYREIPLYKVNKNQAPYGYITIEPIGYIPSERLLHVNAYSLAPNTLYNLWIVDRDTKKRTPAGFEGDNTFKSNNDGAAHFTYYTSEFELGWNKLEISEDPGDGESEDALKVILWTWMYQ
ncbi:MAG: hypothetical protein ACE5DW_03700 [Thermodesulfobacteriota bacterium]